MSVSALLTREDATQVLRTADVMHLAMQTRGGPHVTPELFAWFAGRLWFATARRTLKARLLEPDTRVGVLLSAEPHHLVISGEARPLDPLAPQTSLASPGEAALSPLAATAFLLRNAPHLVGFALQGPKAWPRDPATLRMLVGIRPLAAALVEGDEVVSSAGSWRPQTVSTEMRRRARPVDFSELPEEPADLASIVGGSAVVSLATAAGPVALPAQWDPHRGVASVAPDLLALVGAANESEAAVAIERMQGYAMGGKRGVMLRGDAVVRRKGGRGEIVLRPERATFWTGMETETVSLDP